MCAIHTQHTISGVTNIVPVTQIILWYTLFHYIQLQAYKHKT